MYSTSQGGEGIANMKDLHIKVEQETYIMLVQKDNYNQWIRKAIHEKLEKELEPTFITAKIKDLKTQIQELERKQKASKVTTGQVREILETGLAMYRVRNEETYVAPAQNRIWIKANIVPKVKKAGSTLSEYDILKMFEEGKIE